MKTTTISTFEISKKILEHKELLFGLSEDGVKTLEKTIIFSLPTTTLVVESEYENMKVALFLSIKIQENLICMSFSWHEQIKLLIEKIIRGDEE